MALLTELEFDAKRSVEEEELSVWLLMHVQQLDRAYYGDVTAAATAEFR